MGWRFPWVSSYDSDFNYDFHVSFKPDEMTGGRAFHNYGHADPGLSDLSGDSVFLKDDAGRVFHTYSTYGRGGEEFLGIYRILDVMPKGATRAAPTDRSRIGLGRKTCTARAGWSRATGGSISRRAPAPNIRQGQTRRE